MQNYQMETNSVKIRFGDEMEAFIAKQLKLLQEGQKLVIQGLNVEFTKTDQKAAIIKEFINSVLHFGDAEATYEALTEALQNLPKEK